MQESIADQCTAAAAHEEAHRELQKRYTELTIESQKKDIAIAYLKSGEGSGEEAPPD